MNHPEWIQGLENKLVAYGNRLGSRLSPRGTRYYARTEFWMHAVFPALNKAELIELEAQTGAKFEGELQEFLLWANGMDWTPLQSWPSLSKLILSQFDRLDAGHDEAGQRTFKWEGEP
jgi:hypothetical protein